MRILMVTTKLYPPQFYGGAEMSTHSISLKLQEQGHDVAVLASLAPKGLFTLRNRLKGKFFDRTSWAVDNALGYPVFRGWDALEGLRPVIAKWKPDAVLAQSGAVVPIAEAALSEKIAACVFLRHTHYGTLKGIPKYNPEIAYIANSNFTSATYKKDFDLDCQVIPPLVIPELYRTATDRSRILYINPNPMKGVDLVLDLAEARPDLSFDIAESWKMPNSLTANSWKRAQGLSNVRWLKARSDMKELYRHARLLLVPSSVGHPEWIEAWGRVATEAQYSGIPVLASNSGGLPESVGPGGIVVNTAASFEEWLEALSSLVDDLTMYSSYSRAAQQHAQRPEINPKLQLEKLSNILNQLTLDRAS